MDSPLADAALDLAALMSEGLAASIVDGNDWRTSLAPLLPSVDGSVEFGDVLASPAVGAAARDFARLLGAGSFDPHAPGAGLRMLDHYHRLLREPGLTTQAWAAQKPQLGSRSRGQGAAEEAPAPVEPERSRRFAVRLREPQTEEQQQVADGGKGEAEPPEEEEV